MIVGLNGLKQSGKDTVADYLVEKHGFTRESFAEPMKASAAAALGIPDPAVFEIWKNNPDARVLVTIDGIVEVDISIREYLQFYGTEAHREIPEFGQNVWVDMIYPKIEKPNVVFADSRFENECRALKAAGGSIVKLCRRAVESDDAHKSEAGIPDDMVNVFLDNNGTLEDLYRRVDIMLGFLERSGV